MIPYDDLVAALSAWRASQGLPVSTLGTKAGSGPTPVATSTKSGSGPRTAPPTAPAARTKAASIPPPVAQAEELEVEDAAMLEDEQAYENEGADFAMSFGAGGAGDEATAIGVAPERPTDPTDPRSRNDDW